MKIVLSIIISMALLESSCSKPNFSEQISGTWKGKSYETTLPIDSLTLMAANNITQNTQYVFSADNTFTEKVFSYNSKGTWRYVADSACFSIKYTEKNGPIERIEPNYTVVKLNDTFLLLENKLINNSKELITFIREK